MKGKEHYIKLSETVTGIVEKGCEFKGRLVFEGLLRFGGNFEGEIYTNDILIIDDTANIKADIEADVVVVTGRVLGNINAKSRIEIFKPAVVNGTLNAPVIFMEQGVIFEGTTQMG